MLIGQEDNIKLLELAVSRDMPVLLIGETGTGKTTLVQETAAKQKKELRKINLNGSTSIDEFVGRWLVKDGKTYWQDGILTDAMKKGHWLLIDEINAALPEILFVLHSLLDDNRHIVLVEKDAEVVRCHKDFRVFGTMNPADEYAGVKELNKALLNRFGVVIRLQPMGLEESCQIITERTGIKNEDAVKIAGTLIALREAKASSKIFSTFSIRDGMHWAKIFLDTNDHQTGFTHAILHKAHTSEEAAIKEVYQQVTEKVYKLKKDMRISSLDEIFKKVQAFKKKKETLAREILEQIVRKGFNPEELSEPLDGEEAQEEGSGEASDPSVVATIKGGAFTVSATGT